MLETTLLHGSCFHLTPTLLAVQAACDISGVATPSELLLNCQLTLSAAMSGHVEPPSTTATEVETPATPPNVVFPVPQAIEDMLQAAAPQALPMKFFIACMDKFVKYDDRSNTDWHHMVTILEWLKKESGQVPQASDAQFLRELVFKAKKGHYVFRDDDSLRPGDINTIWFKMNPNFKEIFGRNKPDAEYLEHVRPILKAVGKMMHTLYKGKPETCMVQIFDTTKLIEDIYDSCWKYADRPDFGWTPAKMHRAFSYDDETFESDLVAGTVKFKDWSNLVNYHLINDFDVKKKPGEWDVSAKGNSKGENKGGQKHTAEATWDASATESPKGKSKGNIKNEGSWGSTNQPYHYQGPWPQNDNMPSWDASSSSTGLPKMNQGVGGNGKGNNDKAPWQNFDKKQQAWANWN